MAFEGITEGIITFGFFSDPILISTIVKGRHLVHARLFIPLKLEIITLRMFLTLQLERGKTSGDDGNGTIDEKRQHQCEFCALHIGQFSEDEGHRNGDDIDGE